MDPALITELIPRRAQGPGIRGRRVSGTAWGKSDSSREQASLPSARAGWGRAAPGSRGRISSI